MKSFKVRVSKNYRDEIQRLLNLPDEDQVNWKLLEYVLFYNISDKDDCHKIVVHHERLQTICNSSLPAHMILSRFQTATKIQLNISRHSVMMGLARTIEPEFPIEVLKLTRNEMRIPYKEKENKVFFATGELISDYKERVERESYLGSIMKKEINPESPTHNLIRYLHRHDVMIWLEKRVKSVSPQIHQYISEIKDDDSRQRAERIFHFVEQYSAVEYEAKNITKRIYACHCNIITIDRTIRKKVFSGCWSFDLKSAHLGIVAKLWNLPLMTEFLKSGRSIWTELLDYCGLTEEFKDGLKKTMYAITYGKARRGKGCNVKQYAIEQIGLPATLRLLAHPLIRELLKYRDIELSRLKLAGGATDAFGQFVALDTIPRENEKAKLRSLLSSTVQSYEMLLMLSGFKIIENNPNLLLTAFIHDGCYVLVRKNKRITDFYIKQIVQAVNNKADEFGFVTELEHELLK